jgi:hypothetical protein
MPWLQAGTHHQVVELDHLVRDGAGESRWRASQQHGKAHDFPIDLRNQHRRARPGEPLLDLSARPRRPLEAAEDIRPRQAMELVELVEQRDQGIVVSHGRRLNKDRRAAHAASTSRSAVVAKPKAS